MVHLLYQIVAESSGDDLRFLPADEAIRARASGILGDIVFHRRSQEEADHFDASTKVEPSIRMMLSLSWVWILVHETSHQGPQAGLPDHFKIYISAVSAIAAKQGIPLTDDQKMSWWRELDADTNALLIMSIRGLYLEESHRRWRESWLFGAIAIVLKAMDLMTREVCGGDPMVLRQSLKSHPAARDRLDFLFDQIDSGIRVGFWKGDRFWASRVLEWLDDLFPG